MSHLPFLDHIDPGQGGSAMVIPELPAWTTLQTPEVFPCKQCGAVFNSHDAWFDHRFEKHPLRRPMLVLGDVEVLTPRYTAQNALPPQVIRTVNAIGCRVNGKEVALKNLGQLLAAKPRAFYSIALAGEGGVETTYEISVEIPAHEHIAAVERDFAALASQGRLTVHSVNAFLQQTSAAPTAKNLTHGLANYLFGMLAKDQRGETSLSQEQGRAKLNEAHQTLLDIKRPLPQAIAAVIEFGTNAFQRRQWLGPVPYLNSAMDWYRMASSGQIPPEFNLEVQGAESRWRIPLDSSTHELLDWLRQPTEGLLADARAIQKRANQPTWLHEDRVKASVLLACTFMRAGQREQAQERARAFRHDPVFADLADTLLG